MQKIKVRLRRLNIQIRRVNKYYITIRQFVGERKAAIKGHILPSFYIDLGSARLQYIMSEICGLGTIL